MNSKTTESLDGGKTMPCFSFLKMQRNFVKLSLFLMVLIKNRLVCSAESIFINWSSDIYAGKGAHCVGEDCNSMFRTR